MSIKEYTKKYTEISEIHLLNPICYTCGSVIRRKSLIKDFIEYSKTYDKQLWNKMFQDKKYNYKWCCRKHFLELL